MRKTLLSLGLGGLLAFAGCNIPDTYILKEGEFNGHPVKIGIRNEGRRITIYPFTSGSESKLTALDKDNDGRFDDMHLRELDKGSVLEQYATLPMLDSIYNYVDSHASILFSFPIR